MKEFKVRLRLLFNELQNDGADRGPLVLIFPHFQEIVKGYFVEHHFCVLRVPIVESTRYFLKQTYNRFEDFALLVVQPQGFTEELDEFSEVDEVPTDIVDDQVHFAAFLELFHYSGQRLR